MPRINTPGLVYRYQGEAVSGGLMYYFESGTTTPKTTYKDANESIANTHPVVLNADGTQPNVFFSGSAKQRLTTSVDEGSELVFESDPVGGQSQLGNFSDFSLELIYNTPDLVRLNDKYYQSLTDNNQGNDPETDGGVNWAQVDFVNPVWAIGKTYYKNQRVFASDGNEYQSTVDNNIGNDPISGVNWELLSDPIITNTAILHFYRNR